MPEINTGHIQIQCGIQTVNELRHCWAVKAQVNNTKHSTVFGVRGNNYLVRAQEASGLI